MGVIDYRVSGAGFSMLYVSYCVSNVERWGIRAGFWRMRNRFHGLDFWVLNSEVVSWVLRDEFWVLGGLEWV